MVERLPGTGGRRLGLGRDQFPERRIADGLSHARPERRHALCAARNLDEAAARVEVAAHCGRVSRLHAAERPRLEPLMDDQELDSRLTTGTIYWEGAVKA